eukprot:CAMPEP_0170573052 /NCGR_PEP_ID=MMETSP0224-20130122/2556_1 /TAXON_ID=285029 /ORGANISM="Togula jolla, Strain CCCM 725" /LENGTH=35 /DNA_ID= /DNA_START= /DNA_END= /DNA_ORIENTATION=
MVHTAPMMYAQMQEETIMPRRHVTYSSGVTGRMSP